MPEYNSNVYLLDHYHAPNFKTPTDPSLPSPNVVIQFRRQICQLGPFSPDDNQVLLKILQRLGEIEREAGLEAALEVGDLIIQTFKDDLEIK